MKIICKHNGEILDSYGYESKYIDEIKELDEDTIERVKEILRWRPRNGYDFQYGIGGCYNDKYYKIKSVGFQNNNTEIIVRVSI